jgi:hypothetical protein
LPGWYGVDCILQNAVYGLIDLRADAGHVRFGRGVRKGGPDFADIVIKP